MRLERFANPTSNHIYQEIGYELVRDAAGLPLPARRRACVTMKLRLNAAVLVLVTSLAACSVALPTVQQRPGVLIGCGPVLYDGSVVLHGSASDPAVTWIGFERDGDRENVLWPAGYRARFTPSLEVLDDTRRVLAREGDRPTGGCSVPGGTMIEFAPS